MTSVLDLSRIPLPAAIENLSIEQLTAEIRAYLLGIFPGLEAALSMESEPANAVMRVAVYREFLLRQRVNEAIQQNHLASATGTNLENIAAVYGLERKMGESDRDYRARIQSAPETLSVAGPSGSYEARAEGHPLVFDAIASSPTPGAVVITLIPSYGMASSELTSAVQAEVLAVVGADDVRPLTDTVSVSLGQVTPVNVTATLTLLEGPDSKTVLADAEARLLRSFQETYSLDRGVSRASIIGTLFLDNVMTNIVLSAPSADLPASKTIAYTLGSVDLS